MKQTASKFRLADHFPSYAVAAVSSWLLPGAGHWILGYRVRGAILCLTLCGTFWMGETVLGDNQAVNSDVHPIFFGLQVGNGGSALAANWLFGKPLHENAGQTAVIAGGQPPAGTFSEDLALAPLPEHLNLAILFCSVSGLLNVLVVLHVLDPKTWKEAKNPEVTAEGSGASAEGEAS